MCPFCAAQQGSPLRFSKRIQFSYTVELPVRPNAKRKTAKPKSRAKKPKKDKRSPRTVSPEELELRQQARQEYERARGQNPERKQLNRDRQQRRRLRAKELGLCKQCLQPAIPDQTRCPSCAEKHRQNHKRAAAERRAKKLAEQNSETSASATLSNQLPQPDKPEVNPSQANQPRKKCSRPHLDPETNPPLPWPSSSGA